MTDPVTVPFTTYAESVPRALDSLGAAALLKDQPLVLLKPNLVNDSPHPVTTHPELARAVVGYVRAASSSSSEARVVIGEGTGAAGQDTFEIFHALGWDRLARELDVDLVDLNEAELVTKRDPRCTVFDEMHLPRLAFEAFIVSLPVLKAHSLAGITGTLKNMMGFAPPKHYGGSWKKSAFHRRMQASVKDLNRFILPQLTVMDASVGLADYHLGGETCEPPVGKILAGRDPYAMDREAARLLGVDPKSVAHLWP